MRLDILSENIKWLRLDRNLKMETVAAETGLSTSTLSKLERLEDEPFETSFQNIVTLADYYGVSVDYLLGRKESEELECVEIRDLNLSERAVKKLIADKRHGQILSALIATDSFGEFLDRLEILIDRRMETTYGMLNQYYEATLLQIKKEAGANVENDDVLSAISSAKFDDSFERYKLKEFLDAVLDELISDCGNRVMEDKSIHSPLNELMKSAIENAGAAAGKRVKVSDLMTELLSGAPEEQKELFDDMIKGIDEAVSKQNFTLKRNMKKED